MVFVTPSEKWILLPIQRILVILLHLPSTVILPFRLGCAHYLAQVLTEIGCLTNFVVNLMIIKHKLSILKRILGQRTKETCLFHLRQDYIASLACQIFTA